MLKDSSQLRFGQRIHLAGDSRRIGTVKYVGPVEGYQDTWAGIDWDNGEGKHNGSINGVQYFQAAGEKSGSFVRPQNLSAGISLWEALELRYRATATKEEDDEMYVLSATNKRVSVQLLGKDKLQHKLSRFEELSSASLSYMGVSSSGTSSHSSSVLPNLKELDLTGNLLADWDDIGFFCERLPALIILNLSNNLLAHNVMALPALKNIRILVLNNTGIDWTQVELLKHLLPEIEELHLMGNKIHEIVPESSIVQGFDSLRILNIEDNCIADWNEILKFFQLKSLEQLHLNKNGLKHIFYPANDTTHELINDSESLDMPFKNLQCLLLGDNSIEDLASVDSLNLFPKLMDVRLTNNPITDLGMGGISRFVLIARLEKVKILNGSEVSFRERKDSEIRYVRSVMVKLHGNPEEVQRLHPRFAKLKDFHGIEDERPLVSAAAGPQKMASALVSITLKCVGASIGERSPLTKKLPATTTVGKLKILCESLFKLKSIKPRFFLQEEGSPLPMLLDDEMASLMELGIGNGSTILVDEES